MPNQRDKNKRLFSVSMEKELLEEIQAFCERHNLNRVEFLRLAAEEKLRQSERKKKTPESETPPKEEPPPSTKE